MRTTERRSLILQRLDELGSISVLEEAERFGTSAMTIRRDLVELERTGLARRVHGGAVASRGRSYEPAYLTRVQQSPTVKAALGHAAAQLVAEGDSVAIDTGTTCFEVARSLRGRKNLSIVTPALRVAELFGEDPQVRTILTGGVLRPGENSLVGDFATRAFQSLSVDRLILGSAGIDAGFGISDYNWDDVVVKQAMIRSAKEVVLVADSRKFDHIAFARISGLESVDVLVTDASPGGVLADALRAADIEVLVAAGPPPGGAMPSGA